MWLPKDERRLLAGYYKQLADIDSEKVYRIAELRALLACCGHRRHIPEYGDHQPKSDSSGDLESMKRDAQEYIDASNRIHKAHRLLAERGLLKVTAHQLENDVVVIGLTLDGYDLGRRYANVLESTGLWFHEYKNHWIWLIVAFFGGAFVSKIIDFIGSLIADG